MGAIFAVMKLNSRPCGVHYKERANGHPHCSLAKRDCEGPEGWSGLVGELQGGKERGVGGLTGEKRKKRYGKHLANGFKDADETREIKGEAGTRRPLLKQMAAGVSFLSFGGETKRKDGFFFLIRWGEKFSASKSKRAEEEKKKPFVFPSGFVSAPALEFIIQPDSKTKVAKPRCRDIEIGFGAALCLLHLIRAL